MSITLDPTTFSSEGEYIEALSSAFYQSETCEILAFANRLLGASALWALNTCVYALIWTLSDKKTQAWQELREQAWRTAVSQFSLARCNILFLGL